MVAKAINLLIVLAISIFIFQCSDENTVVGPSTSKEQLGKLIFTDVSLSNPVGQACGTCHVPGAFFTDPDHSAVPHGANPELFGKRNTPTLSYAMFCPTLHYDNVDSTYVGGLFLDGRVNTLEEQAKKPFFEPMEMNNTDLSMLVTKIKNAGFYSTFVQIYGETDDQNEILNNLADAIVAFEKTSEVNPFTSKFDYYLKGEATLTSLESDGMEVFKDTTKGKCANCHIIDPDPTFNKVLFTDFTYDNIGVPKNRFNPYYKMPPEYNPEGPAYVDYGLSKTTGSSSEDGQFKVSTLRNIAVTAPYFHNGVFGTIEEVVHFYNERDVDPTMPPPEVKDNVNVEELGDLLLTPYEERALVAFMKTLTDGYK